MGVVQAPAGCGEGCGLQIQFTVTIQYLRVRPFNLTYIEKNGVGDSKTVAGWGFA